MHFLLNHYKFSKLIKIIIIGIRNGSKYNRKKIKTNCQRNIN